MKLANLYVPSSVEFGHSTPFYPSFLERSGAVHTRSPLHESLPQGCRFLTKQMPTLAVPIAVKSVLDPKTFFACGAL